MLRVNASNKFDSSSDVMVRNCCLRRFNNSNRCSSSKIYSLLRSFRKDVLEKRRIRFDVIELDRIAKQDE
jgi:hypothetical protein